MWGKHRKYQSFYVLDKSVLDRLFQKEAAELACGGRCGETLPNADIAEDGSYVVHMEGVW